jgi:hypothetical protein
MPARVPVTHPCACTKCSVVLQLLNVTLVLPYSTGVLALCQAQSVNVVKQNCEGTQPHRHCTLLTPTWLPLYHCTRSMKEEYQREAAAELQVWSAAQAARQAAKAAKHTSLCRSLAVQLVNLAALAAGYKERTNAPVPRHLWRQWLGLFASGEAPGHWFAARGA